MSGFPNRPGRGNFGPTMKNVRPVVDPTRELSANAINLAWWQLAGAGRTLPQALLIYDGATSTLLLQQLAFDPRGKLGNLPVVRASAGAYTFTFANSYADETGAQQSFIPRAAIAVPQGAPAGTSARVTIAGQVVSVAVQNSVPAAADAKILLQVW